MNCDLGWLRLFVGTGRSHFCSGFNTPGHSTPIYFTSSVLPNARVIYSYPSLFDRTQRDPVITVPSSNARTQRSITLTQHLGGGVFVFVVLFFVIFPKRHLGHEST